MAPKKALESAARALLGFGIAGSYELTRGYNFWLNPALSVILLAFALICVLGRPGRSRTLWRRFATQAPAYDAPSESAALRFKTANQRV